MPGETLPSARLAPCLSRTATPLRRCAYPRAVSPPARPSSIIRRPYLALAAVDPPRRSPTDPLSARAPRPPSFPPPRLLLSSHADPVFSPLPQDASPAPPPTPPDFDLDWRALAVVVEAGSPGVDAAAVQTALLSAPDEHVHDGRAIVFGALSFEELRRDAADAEEDSPLHAVHASILAHQESHASSEDPDKGEWSVPLTLRAELFFAKSHVDAAAHKAEVTAKRQAAVVAAREAASAANDRPVSYTQNRAHETNVRIAYCVLGL